MSPPSRASTPPVVAEHAFATWIWIEQRARDWPAYARRGLGARVVDTTLDAVVGTVDASFLPRGAVRIRELERVNRALSRLRILLRGARELRYISVDQHEHAAREIDAWGRQIGAWLRHERGGAP